MDHSVSKRLSALGGVVALLVLACGGNAPATQAPASHAAATPTAAAPAGTPTAAPPAATPTAAPVVTPTPAAVSCQSDTTKTAIEVQSWWTTGGEATGLEKLFDAFNAANPTLCAYNAAIAGGAGTHAKAIIKARVLGGAPPDTFQVHMGHELLDTYVNLPGGSLLDPLDDIVDASKFPAGVVKIISGTDGHIYTVPENIHRANELWYSKDVFTANNLTAPTTWDEFFTAAETLKGKGISALALGDGDGIWTFGMVFEDILIGELGADGFQKLWTDPTAWSDSKVADALTTLQKVYGYVNSDHSALTWDKANQLVIDGKAAMTLMGDWANGDYVAKNFANYGWAPAPGSNLAQGTIYQALADSFPLPTAAPDKDATKKLLTYMASPEAQDIFNPYKGSIPARIDAGHPAAGAQQYNEYQQSALADWTNSATVVVPSMEHGAAAAPAWASAINTALTAFETSGDVAGTQTALQTAANDALGAQ